jgi:hypothetical protein
MSDNKASFSMMKIEALSVCDGSLRWHDDFSHQPELVDSISQSGISHPLLIAEMEGKIILLHGFRRLDAVRHLKLNEVPVWRLSPNIPLLQAYFQVIEENSLQGEFSLPERLRILHNMEKLPAFEAPSALQRLKLPADRKKLAVLKQMLTLSKAWQRWFAEKQIPVRRALNILRLPNLDLLSPLLEKSPSLSQMENISTMLLDLLAGNQCSFEEIISRSQLLPLLEKSSLAEWSARLKEIRYPVLSAIQNQNQKIIEQMNLPEIIQLQPDPSLESEDLRITIKLRNIEDLINTIKSLEKNKPLISQLLQREWNDEGQSSF